MKSLVMLLVLSFGVSASDLMSVKEQAVYVDSVAKELRRDMWVAGHDYVNSSITKVTKAILDEYVANDQNRNYEDSLSRDEISNLYRCHYNTMCELFLVVVSSEYWGGYGEEGNFVLLNTKLRNHSTISHVIYSE
jgi:hypothetical protein